MCGSYARDVEVMKLCDRDGYGLAKGLNHIANMHLRRSLIAVGDSREIMMEELVWDLTLSLANFESWLQLGLYG